MGASTDGWFPEGGALDRLDKSLSRWIFHSVLPMPLEVLLTVPGGWFGCPIYAIGLTPVLLAAGAARQQGPGVLAAAGCLATLGGGWWLKLCYDSCTTGTGIVRAYNAVGKRVILALPSGAMALATWGSRDGRSAAALYLASWHVAQLLAEVMKAMAWRMRPKKALLEELRSVPRAVSELGDLTNRPSQANLSFPSGDAAGGACVCASLVLAAGARRGPALALSLLSAAGRVYFHCHHLLDVLVGQAVGFAVTFALSRRGRLGWGHVLLSQLFLVCLWKPVQMLKPGPKQDLEIPSQTDDPRDSKSRGLLEDSQA